MTDGTAKTGCHESTAVYILELTCIHESELSWFAGVFSNICDSLNAEVVADVCLQAQYLYSGLSDCYSELQRGVVCN